MSVLRVRRADHVAADLVALDGHLVRTQSAVRLLATSKEAQREQCDLELRATQTRKRGQINVTTTTATPVPACQAHTDCGVEWVTESAVEWNRVTRESSGAEGIYLTPMKLVDTGFRSPCHANCIVMTWSSSSGCGACMPLQVVSRTHNSRHSHAHR